MYLHCNFELLRAVAMVKWLLLKTNDPRGFGFDSRERFISLLCYHCLLRTDETSKNLAIFEILRDLVSTVSSRPKKFFSLLSRFMRQDQTRSRCLRESTRLLSRFFEIYESLALSRKFSQF